MIEVIQYMSIKNEYDAYIPLQGAAKVSIIMIGQQAIVDAYLCLVHLTAGILVGKNYIPQLLIWYAYVCVITVSLFGWILQLGFHKLCYRFSPAFWSYLESHVSLYWL